MSIYMCLCRCGCTRVFMTVIFPCKKETEVLTCVLNVSHEHEHISQSGVEMESVCVQMFQETFRFLFNTVCSVSRLCSSSCS